MDEYDYIIVGAGSAGRRWRRGLARTRARACCCSRRARASHPYSRMPVSFGLLIDNPGRQLALPVRARAGHRQPRDPGAARQAARRLERHQRPGLGARPAARLRHLGADGRRGWSWQDVAPLFTRIENLRERRRQQRPRHRRSAAGHRPCPTRTRSTTRCSSAAKAAGFKLNPDYNSEDQEGVVKTQTSIYKGRRMSVAHCYLEPAMKRRPTCTSSPRRRPCACCSRASAASAWSTRSGRQGRAGARRPRGRSCRPAPWPRPQILELSGIGQPELLKQHGIEVKHELPAVGENFRDHINARIVWRVKDPRVSYNHMARGVGAVDPDDEVPRDRRRLHEPALGAAARLPARRGPSWRRPTCRCTSCPTRSRTPRRASCRTSRR